MGCTVITVEVLQPISLGFLGQEICAEEPQQWQTLAAWLQTGVQSALLSGELFKGISQFKPNVLEVTGWRYLYSAFTGEVKKQCMEIKFQDFNLFLSIYQVAMSVAFGKLHSGRSWWRTLQFKNMKQHSRVPSFSSSTFLPNTSVVWAQFSSYQACPHCWATALFATALLALISP